MLTGTELKVAELVALGLTNREICGRLHYSYNYVKQVVCVIHEKLGTENKRELERFLKGY